MEEENSDEIFYGNLKISFEQQASTNVHSKHINKCIVEKCQGMRGILPDLELPPIPLLLFPFFLPDLQHS